MDQRELTSRVSALQKAINDKEPAANVITIMETLKRDVNATEELLRVGLQPATFLNKLFWVFVSPR